MPLLIDAGHFLFAWRNIIFPVVLLGAGLGTRPSLVAHSTAIDHWVDLAGFGLALLGQLLRVVVLGLRYVTRAGQNRRIWAEALEQGGIFAHCRNPLYIGNFLILLGLAIIHNGWAMYLVVLPFFVFAYSALTRAEEEYLAGRFGDDYRQYCARVDRWRPRLTGWRDTLIDAQLSWRRVLRQEYGTPYAWISGVLLLLVREHSAPFAAPISSREQDAIVAAWFGLTILYLVIRALKRTGRLEGD